MWRNEMGMHVPEFNLAYLLSHLAVCQARSRDDERTRIDLARSIMRGFGDTSLLEGRNSRWRSRGTWKSTCPRLLLSCRPPSASSPPRSISQMGWDDPRFECYANFPQISIPCQRTNGTNDLIWKHQKKELPRFPRPFIAARHHPEEEGSKSSNSSRHDGWGRGRAAEAQGAVVTVRDLFL